MERKTKMKRRGENGEVQRKKGTEEGLGGGGQKGEEKRKGGETGR